MNKKVTKAEIAMAGFGGQGVLTIGLLLAKAGLYEFEHVSWFPTYETWQRGGKVYCCIILSDDEILSPLISKPEALFIFDETSLDIYEDTILQDGVLVYDSSLIERRIKRNDIKLIGMPATKMAQDLGSKQVANLILLGAYLANSQVLPLDTVEPALEEMLKEGKKDNLISLNKKAIRVGFDKVWDYMN